MCAFKPRKTKPILTLALLETEILLFKWSVWIAVASDHVFAFISVLKLVGRFFSWCGLCLLPLPPPSPRPLLLLLLPSFLSYFLAFIHPCALVCSLAWKSLYITNKSLRDIHSVWPRWGRFQKESGRAGLIIERLNMTTRTSLRGCVYTHIHTYTDR